MIESSRFLKKASLALYAAGMISLLKPIDADAAWKPQKAALMTSWSAEVSPSNSLPEYPRPQMVRENWQNLNGEWEFATATPGQTPPFGRTLPESILVPFPIESALSGIMRKHEHMWYRRTFTTAESWNGQRILLHFGAVDWEARVYINGQTVGTHRGGQDSFTFDITDRLKSGVNEIIVGVYDPTDSGENVVGKQRNNPEGIWYTSASGIWQTVWLEPVPAANITRLDMTPDIDRQELRLNVRGSGVNGETVEAVAFADGIEIGRATGSVDADIRIPVPEPRLWSPDDPYLYGLRVTLRRDSNVIDQVTSYFGMRSIRLATVGGVTRPALNGQFVFQMGTLDQGYWPDGIYTAPTDAALRFDLEMHKKLGYNMLRKHIKVEPARWYYWADRLGLLVWQDMPSMRADRRPSQAARDQFERELHEMINEHRSNPSIITWVVQNEGWGQYDQARLADLVKGLDPSRLVNNMSGVNCCGAVDGGNGDLLDWHIYVGPGSPTPSGGRAAVLGEYGGIGYRIHDHLWNSGKAFSYHEVYDAETLTNRYVSGIEQIRSLMKNPGLSAAVYTEITDVENEINGMLTYDRAIMKPDVARVKAVHDQLIADSKGIVGTFIVNQYRSLQVTSPGFTDRYLRHANFLGFTGAINSASGAGDKQDATFKIVPGLSDRSCYSFESRNYAGHYLRHQSYRIHLNRRDGSPLFDQDATFCARPALNGSGDISLESKNIPGSYLRHRNSELWLDAFEDSSLFRQDASWRLAEPFWKSSADLASNRLYSILVKNAGLTNRYIRHMNSLAYTEVIDGNSPAVLKQDASFRVVPGLADNSCYSFESFNFPGQYLRHHQFRLRIAGRDGSPIFDGDATFCAQPGLAGSGVSFQSFNFPNHFMRHANAELWISTFGDGRAPGETPELFNLDATWDLVNSWAQ